MFRFTIRDVLWLTVVAVVCVSWFDRVRTQAELRAMTLERDVAIRRSEMFLDNSLQAMREAGIFWERAKEYKRQLHPELDQELEDSLSKYKLIGNDQ